MKVFVAGATGAIGRPLVPALREAGHTVVAMTRSEERAAALREQGVEAVVADVFDAEAVRRAVEDAAPDAVMHQLTDIPQNLDPRRYAEQMAGNDRIRDEGTRNLVAAARAAGVRRVVAQSIAFAYRPRGDGTLRTEDDPLWTDAPEPLRRTIRAVAAHERQVLEEGAGDGVVLRYGYFHGPGTTYHRDSPVADMVRRRRFPLVGGGPAVWSFVHVDDAAAAAVRALDPEVPAGTYNVVDDEPAPVREWLPGFATALGAKPPRRVPTFVARLAAGRITAIGMTQMEGADNAKAKAKLGWAPAVSWREGFARPAAG